MARRKKKAPGDVVRIALGGEKYAYAHVSAHGQVHFYDREFVDDAPLEEVVRLPIAFTVRVYDYVLKDDRWPTVGHRELPAALLIEPDTFKQDGFTGRLSIYHRRYADTNYERSATLSECRGLEKTAVWAAEHVEDRLRDHFAGVPNKWMKAMAIDESKVPPEQR